MSVRIPKRLYHLAGLLAAGDELVTPHGGTVTKTILWADGKRIDVWLSSGDRLTLDRSQTVVTLA